MRFPVALGLFLLLAGFMISVLRPVYQTGERVLQSGIEATGPVEVYRPVPPWVGQASLACGGVLLVFAFTTRAGAGRKRAGR